MSYKPVYILKCCFYSYLICLLYNLVYFERESIIYLIYKTSLTPPLFILKWLYQVRKVSDHVFVLRVTILLHCAIFLLDFGTVLFLPLYCLSFFRLMAF